MKPEVSHRLEVFWEFVRRAEMDVRENGHKGCPPPSPIGDPWNKAFAKACHATRPHLLQEKRLYPVPPGMLWRPTPITADTATEALMVFLNPTQEVYGSPGVLDTPEYCAIKAAAVAEWEQSMGSNRQPTTLIGKKKKTRQFDENVQTLRVFLQTYHKPDSDGIIPKALTQQQISDIMVELYGKGRGWSQSSVHRMMPVIFPCNGMDDYLDSCSGDVIDGILSRNEDGTTSVDGVHGGK